MKAIIRAAKKAPRSALQRRPRRGSRNSSGPPIRPQEGAARQQRHRGHHDRPAPRQGLHRARLVVKFAGCYHGHGDCLLAKAGSGVMTLGIPSTPGVPKAFTALTAVLPYNDIDAVERFAKKRGDKMAAIIVEPVAANMGVVPPAKGFLEALRRVADRTGALLIFDEVMTGFRVAREGRKSCTAYARTCDAGQGNRRRVAGGRVRRVRGHDGSCFARGAGISGGNAFGQPACHGGGHGDAARVEASGGDTRRLKARSGELNRGLRRHRGGGRAGDAQASGFAVPACFCTTGPDGLCERGDEDTARYAKFFLGCWSGGIFRAVAVRGGVCGPRPYGAE